MLFIKSVTRVGFGIRIFIDQILSFQLLSGTLLHPNVAYIRIVVDRWEVTADRRSTAEFTR